MSIPNVCFHPAHFFPTISYFYSFLSPPPLSTSSTLFPFVVIDGVRQQSTEQRVANSPRQPASERERERLVWWWWWWWGGGRGGGWGLNEERGKREGRKEEGNGECEWKREGEGGRGRGEYERERGAQLKATDLILCIIKQSHSMQHPLYIIHAQ